MEQPAKIATKQELAARLAQVQDAPLASQASLSRPPTVLLAAPTVWNAIPLFAQSVLRASTRQAQAVCPVQTLTVKIVQGEQTPVQLVRAVWLY